MASLFSSLSALGVKLLHGRVPVSEIVVSLSLHVSDPLPAEHKYSSQFDSVMLCSCQIARSVLCWLATDTIGRFRHLKPLYGAPARYHLLAVRGFMGALAMNLYYEALQRLPLGDTVSLAVTCSSCVHASKR